MNKKAIDARKKPGRVLRLPIGVKLTSIVTLILLGSIWIITTLMSIMVNLEFVRTADETNFAINSRTSAGVEERLYQIRSEGLLLLEMDSEAGGSLAAQLRNIFFERNPNIAAVIIPGARDIINVPFFSRNEISPENIDAWLIREAGTAERARAGEPVLRNAAPAFGIHLLALFYPWQNSGTEEAAVIFFSPQNLLEITSAGSNATVVVNDEGDILISPDYGQVLGGENIASHAIFDALWKSTGGSVRLNYTEDGSRYMGAGHRVSLANAAVFTSLEYSIITEQINAVTRRNVLISVTVMFVAILVTWFYSGMVTSQLKRLMKAADQIEGGDFKTALKIRSADELGDMTERFNTMGEGLIRLQEAHDLVGRYNNRGLRDKVLAGELKLDGEFIRAVVLSVDLVSFYTIYQDAQKNTPDEFLYHLNFLISKIVDNVEKTGGVVDKITGANLIAVWGVPFSQGGLAAEVMNCLRSIIAVRTFLWEHNIERESRGKTLYKIHCGVHTGVVLAGRMGSSGYYQYATAGKTIEAAAKAMDACYRVKTDIIITEAVRELAGDRILVEKLDLPRFRKGDFPVYGLVNLAPSPGQEQHWPFKLSDVLESLRERKS